MPVVAQVPYARYAVFAAKCQEIKSVECLAMCARVYASVRVPPRASFRHHRRGHKRSASVSLCSFARARTREQW